MLEIFFQKCKTVSSFFMQFKVREVGLLTKNMDIFGIYLLQNSCTSIVIFFNFPIKRKCQFSR